MECFLYEVESVCVISPAPMASVFECHTARSIYWTYIIVSIAFRCAGTCVLTCPDNCRYKGLEPGLVFLLSRGIVPINTWSGRACAVTPALRSHIYLQIIPRTFSYKQNYAPQYSSLSVTLIEFLWTLDIGKSFVVFLPIYIYTIIATG